MRKKKAVWLTELRNVLGRCDFACESASQWILRHPDVHRSRLGQGRCFDSLGQICLPAVEIGEFRFLGHLQEILVIVSNRAKKAVFKLLEKEGG
jgi:hypothetical protein